MRSWKTCSRILFLSSGNNASQLVEMGICAFAMLGSAVFACARSSCGVSDPTADEDPSDERNGRLLGHGVDPGFGPVFPFFLRMPRGPFFAILI